jgi:hypothetical protein
VTSGHLCFAQCSEPRCLSKPTARPTVRFRPLVPRLVGLGTARGRATRTFLLRYGVAFTFATWVLLSDQSIGASEGTMPGITTRSWPHPPLQVCSGAAHGRTTLTFHPHLYHCMVFCLACRILLSGHSIALSPDHLQKLGLRFRLPSTTASGLFGRGRTTLTFHPHLSHCTVFCLAFWILLSAHSLATAQTICKSWVAGHAHRFRSVRARLMAVLPSRSIRICPIARCSAWHFGYCSVLIASPQPGD